MKRRSKAWRIGIDLGGTKTEGVVLDPRGQEVRRIRLPTGQSYGYEAILERIKKLYRLLARATSSGVPLLGIGTPGSISLTSGLMKNSNTLCLNGRPLKEDLMRYLKRPLYLANDANCFALAEACLGAGRGASMVFGIIMGTGCGGGIVYDGKIWAGHQLVSGEWGHMSIDPRGPKCYCGSRGCVETLISGGGLQRRYRKQFGVTRSAKTIQKGYRDKVQRDVCFMKRFFSDFGRSVANLINVLDPEIIVLGGGLSQIPELYTEGVAQVRKYIFSDSLKTSIVKNQLGDSAGVLGAALLGQ